MAKGARTATSATTAANNHVPEEVVVSKKVPAATGTGRNRKPVVNGTGNGKELATNGTPDLQTKLVNGNIGAVSVTSKDQSPWTQSSRQTLHLYRRTYRLTQPSCHASLRAAAVLTSGIGKLSPSMARPRAKQRVPKETLALAVRKHFNALPVNENEAVVNTLYKARTSEKDLRLRFPATRPNVQQQQQW